MPTSTDRPSHDVPPHQSDRDRQRRPDALDDPRDFETQVSDDDRSYNAPVDVTGEPVEHEDINTHGSER